MPLPPLAFDNPEDHWNASSATEFMFGDRLLIAPIDPLTMTIFVADSASYMCYEDDGAPSRQIVSIRWGSRDPKRWKI